MLHESTSTSSIWYFYESRRPQSHRKTKSLGPDLLELQVHDATMAPHAMQANSKAWLVCQCSNLNSGGMDEKTCPSGPRTEKIPLSQYFEVLSVPSVSALDGGGLCGEAHLSLLSCSRWWGIILLLRLKPGSRRRGVYDGKVMELTWEWID
jgi:hypothetical protein